MSSLRDSTAPSTKPFSISIGGATSNGAKKTSFNLQSSSRASDPRSRILPRRPHQLHHDDESDEDETAATHEEAVTGFDTFSGGAITADGRRDAKREQLVIPVTSKNNWRDRPGVNTRRPRGKKNLLPREVQAMQDAERRGVDVTGAEKNVETDRPSMAYGLSFAPDGDKPMKDAEEPIIPSVTTTEGEDPKKKPLTQDEIALQALIRESKGETEVRSDLVIESVPRRDVDGEEEEEEEEEYVRYDETSSFRTDVASRPDMASLDAYNAVPVEEFGAALLRGMGWKDGEAIGRGKYGTSAPSDRANKPRVPERRPGFLGIGAKDISGGKGAELEIGAWGKAAMRKGSRKNAAQDGQTSTEGVYMPVMMRNKQTGEFITEEEFAALQKETKGKKDDDDWRERRDRNLEKSGRWHRDRRRDYDDEDDSDRHERPSRRNRSSRRDRSLSSSSHHRRRRYDDDDDGSGKDDRYYRERDREREKDRSRRYRDEDRYSSSRHSSSNASSRHGRDRDRDRDRHRDSDRDSHRRHRDDDR